MFLILSVLFGLVGLGTFLGGLLIGLMEIWDLAPIVGMVIFGLTFMFLSAAIWLRMLPGRVLYALQSSKSGEAVRNLRQRPLGIVGILDMAVMQNKSPGSNRCVNIQINPQSTETLLKSIRGATYLIQAIQYSLETNIMSEMGQSVIGSSVIHTAPGCTMLECDSEDDRMTEHPTSPRLSGPEEQWENTDQLRWTNQQLNISLNKTSSSLNVFPYSESRPLDELTVANLNSTDDLAGSSQSGLSRVKVSYNSANKKEVRCIGMSSAFLSRFNNSFRT